MDQHTRRILGRALGLISDYQGGTVDLRCLVDGLEGSLNAVEEELLGSFYARWYAHWGGLEQILAGGAQGIRSVEIREETEALEALLNETLQTGAQQSSDAETHRLATDGSGLG